MTIPTRKGPRRDDGLFGPNSVAWEVLGHPVSGIANARSAVYAALGSEVAKAVDDHSIVFDDFTRRAQQSTYWTFTSVFGDSAEAHRAGKWVDGKHAKVKGYDPVSDSEYYPYRRDLAIAGHGLIWESNLAAYETYVRRLTPQERETYWREGLIAAGLLNIDVETIPPTWGRWEEYREREILPKLSYSPSTDRIMTYARSALFAPRWARPAMRPVMWAFEELTLATMPPVARRILGKPRSQSRISATRFVGRHIAALAALPPIRNAIERANGPDVPSLLTEARQITRSRGVDRAGHIERTLRPVADDANRQQTAVGG